MSCYNYTMQFVFKRDEEGHERIYVGDVCVAKMCNGVPPHHGRFETQGVVAGIVHHDITCAIERADEAGFWDSRGDAYYVTTQTWKTTWMHNEVTVDVPVAETSTTLTLVREDD